MIKIFSLSIVLLFSFVTSVPVDTTNNEVDQIDKSDIDYRLPNTVLPSLYVIKLTTYILPTEGKKQFSFEGTVDITISTKLKDVKEIVLHSKSLTFLEKKIVDTSNNAEVVIDDFLPSERTEKITLKLKDILKENVNYILSFKFSGDLAENMQGFYKSYYLNTEKKPVYLASTQFQTIYARKAFPCFDEPKFKAIFQLTINHDKTLNAVSNMDQKSRDDDGSRSVTIFHPTPKMSTYILAFLISDFKERKTTDNKFLVIARPEAYNQTDYSFEVGQKLLYSLNKYTNLEYKSLGNDKMHLAAIPDFSAGAMENWGLLTYRERSLLYDHEDTTYSAQQSIAAVIAHEQAHMWFGDLVTCDWWSYTWLNEGFARYFQYFTTHEVNTDWEMDKQFVVDQIHSVFKMDSTNYTNPMTDVTAESPDDLKKMFNSISYNKGASIIRMFIHSIGADKFKDAIQKYLVKQKYSTSVPKDLFDFLEAEWKNNEINMTEYFTDWTEQVGYPVVTIKVSEDGKSAEVSQKRFLLEENAGDSSLNYTVPFTFATNNDNKAFYEFNIQYLKKTENSTKIEFKEKINWIVGNVQQIGYYRVNYDTNTWHNIHHALSTKDWSGIHEINRAQIVDDLLNFGSSGILEYDLVLDILDYLQFETNYLPWTAAFNGLATIETRLGSEKKDFTTYAQNLIKYVFDQVGFEQKSNETRLTTYNRAKVLSFACKYLSSCVTKSKELFQSLLKENKSISVNIRSPVYCTALRHGNTEDFDFLWEKYKNSPVATEQVLILGVLGCVKNKDTIEKYYNFILQDDIRLQDKGAALTSIQNGNDENPEILFDLINKDYKKLSKALGDDKEMASVLSSIGSRLTTKSQKEKLEKFLSDNEKNLNEDVKNILKRSLLEIEKNLSSKTLEKFKKALRKKFSSDDKNNNSNKLNISYLITILACIAVYLNI